MTIGEMMLRIKILILALIVTFSVSSMAFANSSLLSSTLEVLAVNESDAISVRLKFTLKNESESPIEVLKWGTPLEDEFTNDSFDVRHNGQPVSYVGMLVKRGTPRPADFIRIGAHQEVSAIVALERGYEIYQEGGYTVQYRANAITANVLDTQGERSQTESLVETPSLSPSNQVEFTLIQGMDEPVTLSRPLAAHACSDAQMNTINAALKEARSIASGARQALRNAPASQRPQAQRYREWFGAYTESRYLTIISHFDRIFDGLTNQQIYASCDDRNLYAYVYPDEPYTIYFGNQFWSAPLNGTDSKAGTFVHEMSHFYVVAGTKDHVYGQSAARNLADIDPDRAINNADSHEYFAENNPPLSMPEPPPPSSSDDDDGGGSGGCFIQALGH